MKDISILQDEYKDLFIKTIAYEAMLDPNDMWMAYNEFDAHKEMVGDDFIGNPQFEAKECLSYWID